MSKRNSSLRNQRRRARLKPALQIESLEVRHALASEMALIGNLNFGQGNLNTQLLLSDDKLLMVRETPETGSELWMYDNISGPRRLTDINPGYGSSNPYGLKVHQGDLYFVASDGLDKSIWKIDNIATTPAFPVKITNNPAATPLVNYVDQFGTIGDSLFFFAESSDSTVGLWKINNDQASLVRQVQVTGSSVVSIGPNIYFVATDAQNGSELWKSDGTTGGTVQVTDLRPGAAGSQPRSLTDVSGVLYFKADTTGTQPLLWRLNAAGVPEQVPTDPSRLQPTDPTSLTNVNGRLVFTADNSTTGREVWSINDQGETFLVKDIMPGITGSQPYGYVAVDGVIYFGVGNPNLNQPLFKTELTDASTVNLPLATEFVRQLTKVGSSLYFTNGGGSLYTTTPAAMTVDKIFDVPTSGSITSLMEYQGRAFFTDQGAGGTLWVSDGTTAGTEKVGSTFYDADANIVQMVNVGGTLYVTHTADDRKGFSTVEPDMLGPFFRFTSTDGSLTTELTDIGGSLYFVNEGSLLTYQQSTGLYIELATFPPTDTQSHELTDVNGTAFFISQVNRSVLKTDGTAAGTVTLKGFDGELAGLVNVDGTLYFAVNASLTGTELWKSDGTASGTTMVKRIYAGIGISRLRSLTNIGGTLFFSANDGTNGYELWRSDGTESGTAMVKNISANSTSSFPANFTGVGNKLYFTADSSGDNELWQSDGTSSGTVRVKDINPAGSSSPGQLTNVNGQLYFVANDGTEGAELWRSDGTLGGTSMVKSLVPGVGSPSITRMTNFNGTLVFTPNLRTVGERLWRSDGTAAGTTLLSTNAHAGSPQIVYDLAVVGNKLFFGGRTDPFGNELFVLTDVDYGDADTTNTQGVDSGAAHFAFGPMLGTSRDSGEADGVRSTNANSDDANGTDDEDGLAAPLSGFQGETVTLSVFVSGATSNTTLSAFFDFNQDGRFSPFPDELIFDRVQVFDGVNNLPVTIPADARTGVHALRLRLSDMDSRRPDGLMRNGEVEDHLFTVRGPNTIFMPNNGPNDIVIRRANDNIEIFDRITNVTALTIPIARHPSLYVVGAKDFSDKIQVDYAAGGIFFLPEGIEFEAGGGIDELTITGSGMAQGTFERSITGLAQVSYVQSSQVNSVSFSGFEKLTFEGLESFVTVADLDIGSQSITVSAIQPVIFLNNVNIAGGSFAASAMNLTANSTVRGFGAIAGDFDARASSNIIATGLLRIGNGSSPSGFLSLGTIQTDGNTLELLDANGAIIGSSARLGTAALPGTLRAKNGLLLLADGEITGFGSVDSDLESAKPITNLGKIRGTDATHRIKLNGYVTDVGQLNFVDIAGTLSPGSPFGTMAYSQMQFSGTLLMELGGTNPGVNYDTIMNSGDLLLGGTLKVELVNGHVPAVGTSYRLIESTIPFTSRFANVQLPPVSAGLSWNLVYKPTTVELQLVGLTLSIAPVIMSENGGSVVGTITRISPDLSQSLTLIVSSSDTTEATVPATVTIAAGQTQATFTISAVDDALLDGSRDVMITVSAAGYPTANAPVRVTDYETLTLVLDSTSVSERNGQTTAHVTRSNTDIDAALLVQISYTGPANLEFTRTVVILAGQSTAAFTVLAGDDDLLNGSRVVSITAAAGGYVSGTAELTVTDYETLSVQVTATSISERNGQTTAQVTRNNTDIASALTVQLTNGDASEISIPVTVTIPAGQPSAVFTINAVDDDLLDGSQTVSITVAAAGYQSTSASLTVTDFEILSLTIDATSISERNGQTTGRVTRSNTDTTSALTVQLTGGDASEVSIPVTVTILAGQPSAVFTISSVDDDLLDGSQAVSIMANAAGYESATANLTVTDFESLSLTIDASSISERNGQTTGRVTRSNTDTTSALTVQLTGGDASEVSIPVTVTILAGQPSAVFTISSVDDDLLDGSQTVSLTAAAAGYESASSSLTVTDFETLSLTIDASSISERNGQTTGRVTRSNTDTTSVLTVQLTGGDASEVSIPVTVTILAGQPSAVFTISSVDDDLLDGLQAVSIMATAAGYESASANLTVTDFEILSLTIDASSISERNGQTTGRVTRSNTDTTSALTVQLTGGDASEISIPATVTIPADQPSAVFTINAVDDDLLDGSQTLSVSVASAGYEPASASLIVTDFETLSLTIDASSISERNGQTTGRVTRSNTDTTSALTVQLTGGDASEVSVPVTVTIPAGQPSAVFTINAVDDDLLDGSQTLSLTATAAGYESASANLTVTDFETLSLTIDASSISERNGQTTGRVTRSNTDTTSALTVQLTDGDASEVSVPVTVTIPAGQPSAVFTINAVDDDLLDGSQTLSLTATAAGYESASANLTVTDFETLSLTIDANSISERNGQTTGRVTRSNTDMTSALTVQLTGGDASEVSVPVTVTIPAGQPSAVFTINAVDDDLLDGSQSVSITATAVGYESANANLTVTDFETLSLTIDASSISERNGQTTGRVTRSNTDTTSTLTVQLTNGDATEISIPVTVTIPAGQPWVAFTISAADDDLLDGSQAVSISAAAVGYESASTSLAVTDFETLSLTIDASSILERNGQATGRVTRNNSDFDSELIVLLTNNDSTELAIPASVTIPIGQASASFTIDAVDDDLLDGLQTVLITAANAGYESTSAELSVEDHETLFITVDAPSISERNRQTTGHVLRSNADVDSPLVVQLTNSDTTELSVPATVTIPAGESTASFVINTINDLEVDGAQVVQLTASAAGYFEPAQTLVAVTDDDRPFPWQSPRNPLDVNDSGQVTALDALLVINAINQRQVLTPELPDPFTPVAYVDVSGDNVLSAIDALLVINRLNNPGAGEGEAGDQNATAQDAYWLDNFDMDNRRSPSRTWGEALNDTVGRLLRSRPRSTWPKE